MSETLETDVAIIGGGISGLATAHFLAKHGFKSRIIEKDGRTGGTIRTDQVDGFLVELGPNSTLDTTPLLGEIIADLGIADSVEYANDRAKNRYIIRKGKLNALPMSPPAFLKSRLFSASAKLRLLKEPFIAAGDPEADESLADFVRRRLGQEFLDYAINPFVAGVYAGDPENLSVRSGFSKLHELEQQYGSLIKGAIKGARERRKSDTVSKQSAKLLSFAGGMQILIDALTREFAGTIDTSANIDSIRRTETGFTIDILSNGTAKTIVSRALLLAIPAYAYGELPVDFAFPVAERVKDIVYPPVSMVFLGYREVPTTISLDGFGFLVPKVEDRNILGTIWSSTIFSGRAPDGGVALTSFIGGVRQPELASLADDELVETVAKDLHDLMKVTATPDTVVVKRWPRAIPQYRVGHENIVRDIAAFEQDMPGLFVSGNFRGGISVADCVIQAKAMSERVTSILGDPSVERQEQWH